MQAHDLLRSDAPFIADTSAWWRVMSLPDELDALRIVRNDRAVADGAMRALSELAARNDGYHRVPLTDALIASAAAEHGVAVLHRDIHFDRLTESLAFESVTLPGS